MKTKLTVLAAITVFLAGCWQKSVYPFFRPEDIIDNKAVLGTWVEEGKKQEEDAARWTFSSVGEKQYLLKVADENEVWDADVRLFRLGDAQFMDTYSRKRGYSEIPAHHLFKFSIREGDRLEMVALNPGWIKDNAKNFPHITVSEVDKADNQEFVLTGNTEALQKMILENQHKEGFYTDPIKLEKSGAFAGRSAAR